MDLAQPTSSQDVQTAVYLAGIWDGLKEQINPFLQILCINGNIYRMLDDYGRQYVARKFM
jgi:hypothetical protein